MRSSLSAGRKPRPILPVPSWGFGSEELDFDDEPDFYKDVYFHDLAPGESPTEFLIRHHFVGAGYEIKRIETAATHPVTTILIRRKSALRITDSRLLFRQIKDLLRRAGFSLGHDELIMDQNGDTILVAILLQRTPVGHVEELNPDEEFAPIPV
jgi:hypothetical protein